MKKLGLPLCAALLASGASVALAQTSASELARLDAIAKGITITRDDWGIAHVHGKTDADAVFGMVYAQAEDDFNRVETNFINSQGRLAEAEGEAEIWRDLRMKLFVNPDSMKKNYNISPSFMKKLMNGWADGLNYYLAKHPDVHPRVIAHFEPWMALTFSEGSIGGDIEKVQLPGLQAMYGGASAGATPARSGYSDGYNDGYEQLDKEPRGSNGIAIAPSNTVGKKHALLWINPHTSFFFRSELQMTSDEGLNAYGAATWGQFFIYQGFNEKAGWMHTTSNADDLDEYAETVTQKGDKYSYKYGGAEKPMALETIKVPYKTASGMASKTFTIYRTQHGPIVRKDGDKWIAIKLMQEPVKALMQSYTRTKAHSYAEFAKTLELHTNSSNNTVFADAQGDIAYFHGNFIPKRDPKFDWTKPVDGSDPATDWHGLLSVDETPKLLNPTSGWIYNTNNAPWTAAGPSSQKESDFPKYVEQGAQNPRGLHAIRILSNKKDFSLDELVKQGYDSYMPAFETLIPALLQAYDALPASDPMKAKLKDQIAVLRPWDYRWGLNSVATSLGVFYGEDYNRRSSGRGGRRSGGTGQRDDSPATRVASLAAASDKLTSDFGKWNTPWSEINRFQRINDNINPSFDDAGPSIPVMFASATWGSLASFGARAYPNTKKWYGTSGNSFIAAVEFGDSVRARAVTAGGESGDPKSKHFNDQAERYATGNLRTVYFYPNQLKGHTERTYHPGA
ncbi:MAG TPA: penicillin acylase family protein [Gemmatimonadaceae bacterium]|jgi:acyl-homoserine-lactone acylase